MSQRERVRVNVILCCDTPGYDLNYIQYATEKCGYDLMTCGYDLIEKSEPEYTRALRYESERPVGDFKRCPGIVRVLFKRLICNFDVYGEHYDMMRQSPIAQKQYDNATKV